MSKERKHNCGYRSRFLCLAAVAIVAALGATGSSKLQFSETIPAALWASNVRQFGPAAIRLPVEGELPSLRGATSWLNSEPLTPADLRGKVALIEFWTYSCINWRRQLPYVRAWSKKYKEQGLMVIGVAAPELTFEKHNDNVRKAAKQMRIDYPILIDNDHAK